MTIEYIHASRYGNGQKIAEEFKSLMSGKGEIVNIHHVKDLSPKNIPMADLYVFSSPGRLGRPIKGMRSFLKKATLPPGTRYSVLSTELKPKPDKNGQIQEGSGICSNRIIPIMDDLLQSKGLEKMAEMKILVAEVEGPLEEGWKSKVEDFASHM